MKIAASKVTEVSTMCSIIQVSASWSVCPHCSGVQPPPFTRRLIYIILTAEDAEALWSHFSLQRMHAFLLYIERSMRIWSLWNSNCYIVGTVNAVNFLFLTHHTTSFLYAKIYGLIPHKIKSRHIFRQARSNRLKFRMYVEEYWFVLFVKFYPIRYGDTAVQS